MLIFVSDLHLVDHGSRASFQSPPLFAALSSRLKEMDTSKDPVSLVLLGDIFELLKSDVWLREKVRPWGEPSQKLSDVCIEILRKIETENKLFFVELQRLRTEFGVALEYLPGNHDSLLGDKDVAGPRQLLRKLIPGLPGQGDELFSQVLADEEHGVVAEHGHELDNFNRRSAKTKRFVPGDGVVIELLVGLPQEVAIHRGSNSPAIDQFDEEFMFLHEMDNVEPQSLVGLLRWLEYRMEDVPVKTKRAIEKALSRGLTTCVGRLRVAMKAHGAAPLARKALWALTFHRAMMRLSVLRKVAKLPTVPANEMSEVAERVGVIVPTAYLWRAPPDLYVAGHTHTPLQQAFATTTSQQMTYLNTGTWRKVHSPVRSLGRVAFHDSYQETLLCVHRVALAEKNGRYELRRYVRGL
jgi:UDP-2,3-diacylglucosamine pyrophosphatase LpxH